MSHPLHPSNPWKRSAQLQSGIACGNGERADEQSKKGSRQTNRTCETLPSYHRIASSPYPYLRTVLLGVASGGTRHRQAQRPSKLHAKLASAGPRRWMDARAALERHEANSRGARKRVTMRASSSSGPLSPSLPSLPPRIMRRARDDTAMGKEEEEPRAKI